MSWSLSLVDTKVINTHTGLQLYVHLTYAFLDNCVNEARSEIKTVKVKDNNNYPSHIHLFNCHYGGPKI